MPTQEIPREQWPDFLESFTRMHEGWLSTVEVSDEQLGYRVEARDLPLQGVATDWKVMGGDSVSIMLGSSNGSALTHTMGDVRHLRIERSESGADETLTFESASGRRTHLRFRCPALPETVDGLIR